MCELKHVLGTNVNKTFPKTLSRIVRYNVASKVTDKFVASCCEFNFSLLFRVFLFSFSLCFSLRFLACIGIRRSTKLDFGLPTDEEDSNGSEYIEVRKQLDKTKKRIKTLVNVVETQNILLRRLVLKLEPEAAMNFDDNQYHNIPPSVEDLATISPDFLDGKESKDSGTIPRTKAS